MAQIFIKRKREPIFLEETRAKSVKNRWLGIGGAVKAVGTEIVDLGSWVGQYDQIVSIEIEGEKRHDEWADQKNKKYTDEELAAFDREMQKYMTMKTSKWFEGEYAHYDTEQYLVDKKAVTYKDHIGVSTRFIVAAADGKYLIDILENKIDQWKFWRDKKEYGRRKRDEELAEIAASVVAEKEVDYPL